MPSRTTYFNDENWDKIQSILNANSTEGSEGEKNFSRLVNEILRLGIFLYEAQGKDETFSLEAFRREVLRRSVMASEAQVMIFNMLTAMYFKLTNPGDSEAAIEATLSNFLSSTNAEADKVVAAFFDAKDAVLD
ncbi:hypothetical protein [Rouxiella badensis]|uniref:relaxosome protein TraM n=1 Tax=Rouxiella badensis TaxID=1646377 RepID=UPI0017883587|nr:hypothetical protein [Rouxiella badensis]QOI58088.1 hypothetical protein H2866_23330 [Rouxiella badensis subsp. acadiensis]